MGVTFNGKGHDQLVITPSFVQSLRDNRVRLAREIEERQVELMSITRQLEAVEILAPHLVNSSVPDQRPFPQLEAEEEQTGSSSLIEAVSKAVRESERPLAPAQIRKQIQRQGDGHLLSSQNYLYTAIKRVAEKGEIVRSRDGTYRVPPGAPQLRENPEARAPGSMVPN
jgi:hypothetical protein